MRRSYILTAASAIALASGWASSASAFDTIQWDWQLDAATNINVDVDVDIKIDPAGATIVEVDQLFKGDLNAEAQVANVHNNPNVNAPASKYWPAPAPAPLNAVNHLPAIENTAAAIGNSTSIESQVSVQADINQSVYDNDWYLGGAILNAFANVQTVTNTTVENTAQAIGNSASITLDPSGTGPSGTTGEVNGGGYCMPFLPCGGSGGNGVDTDNFLMANISQFANFDGYATAHVNNMSITGYEFLGAGDNFLGRPIVANTAVAVGNIATIKVLNGALDD